MSSLPADRPFCSVPPGVDGACRPARPGRPSARRLTIQHERIPRRAFANIVFPTISAYQGGAPLRDGSQTRATCRHKRGYRRQQTRRRRRARHRNQSSRRMVKMRRIRPGRDWRQQPCQRLVLASCPSCPTVCRNGDWVSENRSNRSCHLLQNKRQQSFGIEALSVIQHFAEQRSCVSSS